MIKKLTTKRRSLANLIVRLIVIIFGVLTVGVMVQSYHFSSSIIKQEVARSSTQTSSLLQNLLDYKLATLQSHQDSNALNITLQNNLISNSPDQVDFFFLDLEQNDPLNSPDFRFITSDNGDVEWHDGNGLFYGLTDLHLERISTSISLGRDWHYISQDTVLGERNLLIRRTPIISLENGQVLGHLYIAIVLNRNLSLIDQLQVASNSDAVIMMIDYTPIASTINSEDPLYNEVLEDLNQDNTGSSGGHLFNATNLLVNGEDTPIYVYTIQTNSNILTLEENYKVGLAISMFTMFALALLTRQIIQRLVSNELKSLMEYTRSAGDRIESSEFQGSSIYEFDHVGHTLEKTFEELREKDKSFQDLFNFSLSPIIVWDTEGGVLRMNPAAERALNSKLDMSDSEIDDRFKSFQSKVAFYLRMVMTGETLMGVNVPIENKIYRWNLSPLEFDNEIHAIIGQGQDITTLIEAEKQSNLARIEAERSAVARADFLAKMSHEIRTPLNGILGITQILQSTLDKPENKEKVDILYQSGEHLLTVLNDILDFSKIEQGKLNIEFNEFVFRDLVKSLETIYMPLCVNKGLSLEIQNEIPEKQIIRTDQVRLNQILFNLLSNAVKFTSEGGVIVRFMMESHEPGKEILKLEVRDSGIGISESSLETMFEPFIQAESTTTREYGGSGLGLAIVKNLLDLMGGSIKVTSMQGEGASFYIQLPVTVVSQIQREEVEASNHEDPATLFDTSIRVLLVEDNKSNAFIAKAFCQKYGMEVDWAEDGLIALEKVQTQEYDLILMDNQMPNLDGVEATRRMRHEMGIETPIYACTADAFESTKNAFLEAGANFVIVKPLKEKPLYNAFHHFKVKDLKVVNGDNAATGT
ncbi:LuxQ periplasmic sensor domain-containing protein [Vibrio nigripulchritudo]|uniref:LuxQ periplasmic sensor domain-containing protein n=1 Tax=Vibrio nigripulchritudo TaxID=28173 RepID=UPI0003B1F328|nr:LuxQ periplasmic sensor domain-containing protein [Vibrio nigripulchritudo]CCN68399.1 Autoinducer 2 sensor kinase/phosphatase luxQ [Vibrio nigripulchritudo SFn118]